MQVDSAAWNVLMNVKGRLFVRNEASEWVDKGVGMYSIRQPTQGSGKTYLMFTTLVRVRGHKRGCKAGASTLLVYGCCFGNRQWL